MNLMGGLTREIKVDKFDLRHTVESAQPLAFFGDIKKDGRGVTYSHKDSLIEAEQEEDGVLKYGSYGGLCGSELRQEIETRFRLHDDMKNVYEAIGTDRFMNDAIKRFYGMRITKNDPWETTLCFLISQFNNVKRIRGIVKRLVSVYGEEHIFSAGGVKLKFNSFPTPEEIARHSVKDLMTHGAGFRAKYIESVAHACSESFDLDKFYNKKYCDAKEELMELDGIGDKVADCILLFGYGKMEAFPIDTWVKRVMEKTYFKGGTKKTREISSFASERWGRHAGYAQQYIFWEGRSLGIGK